MTTMVSNKIIDLMTDHNLTQQALANKINVSQSQVSDWIAGKSKPSFDTIRDICLNFNISADCFLGLKAEVTQTNKTKFNICNRRYTGSKLKIKNWISSIIAEHCKDATSFCDIFAGTGIVTDEMYSNYDNFVINDLLYSNEVIYKAFFKNEAFNLPKIFQYQAQYQALNGIDLPENYISENFGGKYFEHTDAKLIGHIRQDIENNKIFLNDREYSILLASLLYSLDKCANTVGHYEAYFKNKDLKSCFKFELIQPRDTISDNKNIQIFRKDANVLAKEIHADIVYIDPPYSSRQYSRFYHVLENITKWEKPELFGAALKPAPENMSEYCSSSAKKAFKSLIDDLDCKYIIVSYNNTYNSKSKSSENKMLLEDIMEILSEKGLTQKYEMPFKAFNAGKTNIENHKELVFITEVGKTHNSKKDIVRSPFFYVGDKYKLMGQLLKKFPKDIDTYYEPFCGGGSSFMNVVANKFILNDIDKYVIKLHNMLNRYANTPELFYLVLDNVEDKYHLSASHKQDIIPESLKIKHKKTYFAKFNKLGFEAMRNDFNQNKNDIELLYVMLIYGFNRMLRFNSKGDFNLPVGNVDLNQNVLKSLDSYFKFARNNELHFSSCDFREFLNTYSFKQNDFIYLDPPYLISSSEYNKFWTSQDEIDLLKKLDELNAQGIRFAISNLLFSKDKENLIFKEWSKKYNVYDVNSNYISYHDNSIKDSKEVLVTNYD